jgi:hypothetical protein
VLPPKIGVLPVSLSAIKLLVVGFLSWYHSVWARSLSRQEL